MNRGKLVTVGIVLVAVAAASTAWWYSSVRGKHALAFWGGPAAFLIRTSEWTELWRFADAGDDAPASVVSGSVGKSNVERFDVSRAPGLVHLRQALISDASYDWTETLPDGAPNWQFALHFRDDPALSAEDGRRPAQRSVTVLVDTVGGWVAHASRPNDPVRLKVAEGMRVFVKDLLSQAATELTVADDS